MCKVSLYVLYFEENRQNRQKYKNLVNNSYTEFTDNLSHVDLFLNSSDHHRKFYIYNNFQDKKITLVIYFIALSACCHQSHVRATFFK